MNVDMILFQILLLILVVIIYFYVSLLTLLPPIVDSGRGAKGQKGHFFLSIPTITHGKYDINMRIPVDIFVISFFCLSLQPIGLMNISWKKAIMM